ncbi:MAG: D-alanyl-D-alanine carboxypeptidase/D-alanyl-D-alanine endopeptidase [Candidatus Longimicrobiales bacterium M2_2A_002]
MRRVRSLRRRPGHGSLLLIAGLLLGLTPATARAQATETVGEPSPPRAVLDSILDTPPLSRAHWGVAVYDLADGAPVLRHNPDRLFTSASTMKLVTAAAALDLLGPEYRFETVVEGPTDEQGRADSLVVRGGGDPSLGEPFHDDPLAPLDSLADSLRARGLRTVDGPVVIDQSRFDSTLVHPAWETFDLDWYYAAPVTPFAIMSGAFEIVVTPGRVGSPAAVTVSHGAGLVGLDARIRTVPGDDDWDDVLRRLPDGDSLILRGAIGAGSGPDTSWIAQTRPGHTAGMALQRALERAGIRVTGPVVVRYGAGTEPAGTLAPARVVWRSPPLDAIIRVALERSDNWVTEQVLKAMAAALLGRGDWRSGTDLVEEYIAETVGVPRGAIYMRDGSGLTPQGLLTPDAVATLLRYADARPWGPRLRNALASPGESGSTLDDRLLEHRGRVAAKTGTLRHVNALSGYITTRDGRELVFSILSTGSGRPSWEVQAAVDRIVESLIESGS